jgi:hypothetical protein
MACNGGDYQENTHSLHAMAYVDRVLRATLGDFWELPEHRSVISTAASAIAKSLYSYPPVIKHGTWKSL